MFFRGFCGSRGLTVCCYYADGCYANWFFAPIRVWLGPEKLGHLWLLRELILCFVSCGFRRLSGLCTSRPDSRAQDLKFRAQNFDLHRSDPQRSGTANCLVSKCSATLANVAAPPLERDSVSEVETPCDTPRRWHRYTPHPKSQEKPIGGARDGVRKGPLVGGGGGVGCNTVATLETEGRAATGGVATPRSATGGLV